MKIIQALSAAQIVAVQSLFEEYAASLGIDLAYQAFDAEQRSLPGAYAPPRGRLLLALVDNAPAGCGALRPHEGNSAEMKRLYVRPSFQGRGIGRKLAEALTAEAQAIGYSTVLLDTLPSMHGALRLYKSLGFVRREAYFLSPVAGNVFMELSLG